MLASGFGSGWPDPEVDTAGLILLNNTNPPEIFEYPFHDGQKHRLHFVDTFSPKHGKLHPRFIFFPPD